MRKDEIHPCCLTIAGSDSGGNAGVQADLRAFHAYGLHGCTVFAALTAQNPRSVSAVHQVPPQFVAAQLDAVLGTYDIRALKTGMLSDPQSIEVIADRLSRNPSIYKVVDPVMVATSGVRLVSEDAVRSIKRAILPIATLVTPNLPEAEILCGREVSDPNAERGKTAADAADLARRIHDLYGCAVLVKGGHGSESTAVDVLFDGSEMREFSLPWITDPISTHGTGCSLSAALAAELALGRALPDAVAGAKAFVHDAVENSYLVGPGCGVLDFARRKVDG
ncbi:MAG: bifunctional hydroxymethylpyrimidine kinase/phosphomethylpyrimidine kinase [Lentisphaerae bacterium]|jgi:hydroxymethylpyrimidine/phosphomethylpyrimidine kinase|nr:bifunctional hydroxymethylpyrimidine kinase/phosphomethylpyrimidine kinase [Lentisphaerota bacterium]